MAKINLSADFFNKTRKIYIHLQSEDSNELLKLKKTSFFSKFELSKFESSYELRYSLALGAVDSFLSSGIINKMYSLLESEGNELNMTKEQFASDIEIAKKSIPTPEVLNKAMEKRDNLIERFFQQYNTEEVQREIAKLTQNIKINVGDDKEYKNVILSNKNKLLAYAQKPDCTYITSQKSWRKYFSRRVKANATPIYIYSGDNQHDYNERLATQQTGLSKSQSRTNRHKAFSYDRVAKFGDSKPLSFFIVVYYDYSDTEPYDANYDPFNDDSGLESNLTGDYNNKAKEDMRPSQEADDIRNDIRNKLGLSEIDKKAMFAFDNIIKYCNNHKDEFNSVLISGVDKNKTEGITEVLRQMFKVVYDREHDLNKLNEKVNISTCFSLAAIGVANNSMLDYMASNGKMFNQKELLNMYSQCCEVIGIMQGVNESSEFRMPTFKEFLNALNVSLDSATERDIKKDEFNQFMNSDSTNEMKESIIRLMNKLIK